MVCSPAVPASGIKDANPSKALSWPSTQPEHVRPESQYSPSSCSPGLERRAHTHETNHLTPKDVFSVLLKIEGKQHVKGWLGGC